MRHQRAQHGHGAAHSVPRQGQSKHEQRFQEPQAEDPIVTVVLPLVWAGVCVGVVQLTAPGADSAGIFFDDHFNSWAAGVGGGGGGGALHLHSEHLPTLHYSYPGGGLFDRAADSAAVDVGATRAVNATTAYSTWPGATATWTMMQQLQAELSCFIGYADVTGDHLFSQGPAAGSGGGGGGDGGGGSEARGEMGGGVGGLGNARGGGVGVSDPVAGTAAHRLWQQTQSHAQHAHTRSLHASMMHQLLQLGVTLQLGLEGTLSLLAVGCGVAEVLGVYFPPGGYVGDATLRTERAAARRATEELQQQLSAEQEQRRRQEQELQELRQQQRQAEQAHAALQEEAALLQRTMEKLHRSRAKYVQKSQQLEQQLKGSHDCSHALRKAEAKLK